MIGDVLLIVFASVGVGYGIRCNPVVRSLSASGWPIVRCPACLAFWAAWVLGFEPFAGHWPYWCVPFAAYTTALCLYRRMASACGLDSDTPIGA